MSFTKQDRKDNTVWFFLDYLRRNGSCTAREFVSNDERVKRYNVSSAQFGSIFRQYKGVEPYASMISCDSKNNKGSTLYKYVGD